MDVLAARSCGDIDFGSDWMSDEAFEAFLALAARFCMSADPSNVLLSGTSASFGSGTTHTGRSLESLAVDTDIDAEVETVAEDWGGDIVIPLDSALVGACAVCGSAGLSHWCSPT